MEKTRDTFFTVPNLLTLGRIAFVPVFLLMVLEKRAFGALLVFSLAGLTDVLDGFAARAWHQRTKIGTLIDPLADKVLLSTAFILLTFKNLNSPHAIPLWLTVTVLSRDFIILAGGLVVYLIRGQQEFRPSLFGKISTVLQVGTVFWVLLANYIRVSPLVLPPLLFTLISPTALDVIYGATLAFTVISGAQYILRGIRITFFSSK
jgi:cardiolipin synthase